jgi:hypothetical protein
MRVGWPGKFCGCAFSPPNTLYLIRFFLEIYHFSLEVLRTFTGIFPSVLRSEVLFSEGGTFQS